MRAVHWRHPLAEPEKNSKNLRNQLLKSCWSGCDQLGMWNQNQQPSQLFSHRSLVWGTSITKRHSARQEAKVHSILLNYWFCTLAFNLIDFSSFSLNAENMAAWLSLWPLNNFSCCCFLRLRKTLHAWRWALQMQSDINSLVTQNRLTLSPTLAVHTGGQMSAANRPDVCFLEAGAPAEEPTHTLLAEHTNPTRGKKPPGESNPQPLCCRATHHSPSVPSLNQFQFRNDSLLLRQSTELLVPSCFRQWFKRENWLVQEVFNT